MLTDMKRCLTNVCGRLFPSRNLSEIFMAPKRQDRYMKCEWKGKGLETKNVEQRWQNGGFNSVYRRRKVCT